MKPLLSFFLLSSLLLSCGRSLEPNEIHDPIFNWTITVPKGFRKIDKLEIRLWSNGNAKIVTSDYARTGFTQYTPILAFTDSNKYYLSAIGQPFNEKKDGKFPQVFTKLSRQLAEAYTAALTDPTLVVSNGEQNFDHQTFLEYNIKVQLARDTFYIDLFGKQFGDKILLVQLHYYELRAGNAMRRAFISSTFD